MGKFWKLSCFLLLLILNIYSDAVFKATSDLAVGIQNNTPSLWKAGGVRFYNDGFNWSGLDNGYTQPLITNTTVGSNNEVEVIIKSSAPGQEVKIAPGLTFPFGHKYAGWPGPTDAGIDYDAYTPEVLLRTGAAGKADDPVDPDPITIDQLDSLMKTPDYYDSTYRYNYTDSLGVNGGIYSGGFLDTWYNNAEDKPETQIQVPYPLDTFTLNNFDLNIDTSVTKGPMYWISLAIAQEYFRVDLQWMMTMGIKEGNAGVKKQHYPNDVVYDGSFNHTAGLGAWHTEGFTGVDRAMTYSDYFPKYRQALSTALDLGSSGLAPYDVTDYYCGASTDINSAQIINTLVFSVIVQYANYDVFAYCTDVCWKEALSTAVDPYMGLVTMLIVYNVGNSQVANVAGKLNANAYATTCADPNARTAFGTGYNNYIPDILDGVQNFIDASARSRTDQSVEILDYPISKRELLNAYFGDDGTVNVQGDGGLLLHFYDPTATDCINERQQIWDDLNALLTWL